MKKEWLVSTTVAIALVSLLGLGMHTYERYEQSDTSSQCGEYKQILVAGKLQTIKITENCEEK